MELQALCVILSLVCFVVELFRGSRWPSVRLIALGLFFFVLSLLVSGSLKTP